MGGRTDQAVVDGHLATINKNLDVYEKILSKQKYLAGDSLTLADLYHIPTGAALQKHAPHCLENENRPNVTRWWKEISSRPSWQAVKDEIKSTA